MTDLERIAQQPASALEAAADKRILVLDGAMGTMIQKLGLTEEDFHPKGMEDHKILLKGNNELLSLSRPEAIRTIHEQYLEAGADIVETNTFSATSIAQAEHACSHLAREMNLASVRLAKEACAKYTAMDPSKPRFVAGAIGPMNKTASLSPDVNDPGFRAVTFDQLVTAYKEQAEALLDAGADILLVETIFDTLNAKAAFFAIDEVFEARNTRVPLMCSVTITDASGRTLSGQTIEAFLISMAHVQDPEALVGAGRELPWVACSEFMPDSGVPYVSIDHRQAAVDAVQYLLNRGHRRIALLHAHEDYAWAQQRRAGYEIALTRAGVALDPALIRVARGTDYADGIEATGGLLSLQAPPTALFAVSDTLAIGAIKAFRRAGRRVPDDVAIVGFDNVPLSEVFEPSLTTIAQPMRELGATAAELLLERLAGGSPQPRTLAHTLVVRESG